MAKATGAELVVAAVFGPMLPGDGGDLPSLEAGFFHDVFAKAEAELGQTGFQRRELRQVPAWTNLLRMRALI